MQMKSVCGSSASYCRQCFASAKLLVQFQQNVSEFCKSVSMNQNSTSGKTNLILGVRRMHREIIWCKRADGRRGYEHEDLHAHFHTHSKCLLQRNTQSGSNWTSKCSKLHSEDCSILGHFDKDRMLTICVNTQ